MDADRRAYDRGSTIFSPDGRLYQVEYAREAVRQGATGVGVTTAEGVVLAGRRRLRSPLVEPGSVRKLHKVDAHVGAASAGVGADARRLVDRAREFAQADRVRYDEPPEVDAVVRALGDHVQEYTQAGGTRPYGASLLVGGVDDEPRLYEVDPGGATSAWRAAAVGADARDVQEHLAAEHEADLDLEAGLDLAVAALADAAEETLDAGALDVVTVAPEFERVPAERVAAAVEAS